jgi:hypothetical protein
MRFQMRDQPRTDALSLQARLDEQRTKPVALQADRADDPVPLEADEDVAFEQPLGDLVRSVVGADQLDDGSGIVAGVGPPHRPPDELA